MPVSGGSLICYHAGTCSPPNLDKVKSWLGLHPDHFKPNPQPQMNSHPHFPKLGIRQYSQVPSSYSGAGITELPTSHPDCFNARQGRKGPSSHLLPAPLACDSEPCNTTGCKRPCLGLAKITLNNAEQRWKDKLFLMRVFSLCYKMQQLLPNCSEVFH